MIFLTFHPISPSVYIVVVCHPHIIWIITYHLTIDKMFFDNRIKHQKELVGKSTATHACILAPGNVSIHNFPVSFFCILNHQKNVLSILSCYFISFIPRHIEKKEREMIFTLYSILSFCFFHQEVPDFQENEEVKTFD